MMMRMTNRNNKQHRKKKKKQDVDFNLKTENDAETTIYIDDSNSANSNSSGYSNSRTSRNGTSPVGTCLPQLRLGAEASNDVDVLLLKETPEHKTQTPTPETKAPTVPSPEDCSHYSQQITLTCTTALVIGVKDRRRSRNNNPTTIAQPRHGKYDSNSFAEVDMFDTETGTTTEYDGEVLLEGIVLPPSEHNTTCGPTHRLRNQVGSSLSRHGHIRLQGCTP
jgi:hypothetical protein